MGVSLAISKDLGGVRWGVLEVSGVGSFWRRGHLLRAAFLSPRRSLGPAIVAGIMACESAVPLPCHSCHLADVAIN